MKTVLYITFIDFGDFSSGSLVRPQMMHRAFQESGLHVVLLNGSQETAKKEQRRKNVEEINKWLDHNRPDFCYIEPPTYPILHSFDIRLIKRIHAMGIPVGYFFRDAYYKLGKEFYGTKKQSLIRWLKNKYLRALYYRNEKLLFHAVDIVYFPTMTMAGYFSYRDMRALPPAGEKPVEEIDKKKGFTGIYVGGISPSYGTNLMLEAYQILNSKEGQEYPLYLVCRETEQKNLPPEYEKCSWLKIFHASGAKELAPLYEKADVALLPRTDSPYNDLSFSVKVFEYMQHALPIVACGSKEMALIIKKYHMGGVTGFTPEKFAETVRSLLENEEEYRRCSQNARNALLNENLWIHRVKTVQDDLLSLEKS